MPSPPQSRFVQNSDSQEAPETAVHDSTSIIVMVSTRMTPFREGEASATVDTSGWGVSSTSRGAGWPC
jgi:hypothetical protein